MKMSKFSAAALLIFLTAAGFSCASVEVPDSEIELTEEPLILMPDLKMPEVGEAAPPFEISTLEGKAYNLKDETEGKVVSMVFWSLFCAPCRRSMPILNDLYKELRDSEFELLTINMDGERMIEGVKTYAAEEELELVILMDEYDGETMKVADPYGVQGTPTTYLIGKDGNIAFSKVGDVERDEFRTMILRELEKPNDAGKTEE